MKDKKKEKKKKAAPVAAPVTEPPLYAGCKTTITHASASDHLGRCHFKLSWTAKDGSPTSQTYFDDPRAHGHRRPEDPEKAK